MNYVSQVLVRIVRLHGQETGATQRVHSNNWPCSCARFFPKSFAYWSLCFGITKPPAFKRLS